jgi:hypothetical protein
MTRARRRGGRRPIPEGRDLQAAAARRAAATRASCAGDHDPPSCGPHGRGRARWQPQAGATVAARRYSSHKHGRERSGCEGEAEWVQVREGLSLHLSASAGAVRHGRAQRHSATRMTLLCVHMARAKCPSWKQPAAHLFKLWAPHPIQKDLHETVDFNFA